MKSNIINQVITGFLGATVLLGAPSCSDDHYDIKPGIESAGNTLWQNIEGNQQLDSLAMILKRVKVYSKEEDKSRTMTYADLLNGSQTFTLWAPLNGTYNAKHYLDQLDKVDALVAEGKFVEANKLEYNIGVQFAQNHLARFNYESSRESQEVRLFNGKICTYNAAEKLFNGVDLNKDMYNVPANNGTMHVIDGESPFAYNIYDYLAANADIFSNVYGTLSDPNIDKKVFSESLSIPGALNENGQMVYVDSVFISNNDLLNESHALVKNEDSLYIAAVPTDAAWDQAFEKVKKLFNYSNKYNYDYNNDETSFASTLKLNADSLNDYNTKKALITSMYFSPSIFGEEFERDDVDGMLDYAFYSDSLISTNGVVYYNYKGEGQKNPIFGNDEPVKASNGIIIPLTTYDMDPSYSFMKRSQIDLTNAWSIGDAVNCANGHKGTYYSLVEGKNWDTTIDLSDLENKAYRYFEVQGNMSIYIPIPNLYSGKYRIKIQLLPNRADEDHKWKDKETGEEVMQGTCFYAELRDDQGDRIGKKSEDIHVSDDSIKTYTLWESIEIPKCYVNLPAGIEKCYPLLQLQMPRRRPYQTKPKNVNSPTFGLSVLKLIVEPVRE